MSRTPWWDLVLATPDAGTDEWRRLCKIATQARDAHLRIRWRCVVCGVNPFDAPLDRGTIERGHDYMVRDHIWAEAGFKPTDNACLVCLEAKLGRQLVVDDLKPVITNSVAILMMKRGRLT